MENKTYPEICNQYDALKKTAACVLSHSTEIKDFFGKKQYRRLIVIGSGSSYSLSKSAACTANLLLPFPAMAIPAGDLMLHMETYTPLLKDALVLVLSRSGSTDEIVHALELLQKGGYGAEVCSIVAVEGSRVSKLSGLTLEIPWAFDESVCQTRSVTNLLGAAQLVIGAAAGRDEIARDIQVIAEQANAYLSRIEPVLKEIAGEDWKKVLVLADAEANGAAEEGSLAFNEICYIPSSCKHILDVRHGPMVLVDKETLALVHLNADSFSYQAALVEDLKKKGARVILYSAHTLPQEINDVRANIVFGQALCSSVEVIPMLAIAQLLSYYNAINRGINPDQPPGLDPWIAL